MGFFSSEIVFQISIAGIAALLSIALAIIRKKPEVMRARIGNPWRGNKLIDTDYTTDENVVILNEENIKEWCRKRCAKEQDNLMKLLNRETTLTVSKAVNGWKASTEQQIANMDDKLDRLYTAMDNTNKRLDSILHHMINPKS